MEALNISRRQAVQWVVCLLAFAFLTRLCIGMLYYNTFDVNWYKTWALELQNGFFRLLFPHDGREIRPGLSAGLSGVPLYRRQAVRRAAHWRIIRCSTCWR